MAFVRVSVENDVQDFCGWDFLIKLVNTCKNDFQKALIAFLFETGCRVSELLMLKKHNFFLDIHPELIVVDKIPVLKKYKRVKIGNKVVIQKVKSYRTIPIKKSEPLAELMLSWLEKTKKDDLFPQLERVKNKRHKVLYIIRKIGSSLRNKEIPSTTVPSDKLWPHWFRSQRARQLVWDYDFTPIDLAAFFNWEIKPLGMIPTYAKPGWRQLALKMGVDVRDTEIKRKKYLKI